MIERPRVVAASFERLVHFGRAMSGLTCWDCFQPPDSAQVFVLRYRPEDGIQHFSLLSLPIETMTIGGVSNQTPMDGRESSGYAGLWGGAKGADWWFCLGSRFCPKDLMLFLASPDVIGALNLFCYPPGCGRNGNTLIGIVNAWVSGVGSRGETLPWDSRREWVPKTVEFGAAPEVVVNWSEYDLRAWVEKTCNGSPFAITPYMLLDLAMQEQERLKQRYFEIGDNIIEQV